MAYTTIDNPELHFQCKTYTGNNSTNAITLDGSENMQPDFVWTKNRGSSGSNYLHDAVRGATYVIASNATDAQTQFSNGLTSFNSDGFTLGDWGGVNSNGNTFVSWNWKGGTTSGITTNGSTTITPSAYSFNATAGIAILQYTGNSTAGAKLAHGIGGCDAFWIKRTPTAGDDWRTYNRTLGGTKNIKLNSDDASATGTNIFNDTDPDSVNITLGSHNSANASEAMICYAFKSIQGFSKVGSYEGNGNANGAFIYTGFRPAFLLVKNADATGDWVIYDNKRSGYNGDNRLVYANLSNAEEAGSALPVDFLSNGFKCKTSANLVNSTDTIVYVAFAESPFVNSNGVPNNAR